MSLYPTSTQYKHWTFKSVSYMNTKLTEVNARYITEQTHHFTNVDPSTLFLSSEEERIVKRHFEFVIKSFCDDFQPKMPPYILATSLTYFKRYYLVQSVMNYHPEDILYTCVFLACKVEEFNVSITQFVRNIHHRKKERSVDEITDIILAQELHLMSNLNFQLTIHNPFRAVNGFIIDMKTRCLQFTEKLTPPAYDFIHKSLFSNTCFFFSPSQIGLAALTSACNYYKIDLKGYIDEFLYADKSADKSGIIYETIQRINDMIKDEPVLERTHVKTLLKKLQICRNPENDYNSDVYKELQREAELKLERELIYEMDHDL